MKFSIFNPFLGGLSPNRAGVDLGSGTGPRFWDWTSDLGLDLGSWAAGVGEAGLGRLLTLVRPGSDLSLLALLGSESDLRLLALSTSGDGAAGAVGVGVVILGEVDGAASRCRMTWRSPRPRI